MHTLHCTFATLRRQDFQAICVAGEAQEHFPVDGCNALPYAMKMVKEAYGAAPYTLLWSFRQVAHRRSPRRREEAPEGVEDLNCRQR